MNLTANGPPRRPWATLAVFVAALVGFVVREQWTNPIWAPSGPDWDSWYASALAFRADVPFPPVRWPAYGALTAAIDALGPGPLHVVAMLVAIGATAATTAAVFHLGSLLAGPPGGLAAALLFALLPVTLVAAAWMNAYPLWTAAAAWAAAGLAEGARSPRPAGWVVAGTGAGLVLAIMEKGLGIGLLLLALGAAVAVLLHRRRAARPLLLFAAPVVALALAYAAFPVQLASLELQADLPGRAPAEEGTFVEFKGQGYVFGQSMGPRTLARALLAARTAADAGTLPERWMESIDLLSRAFPKSGAESVAVLGLGLGVALLAAARRDRAACAGIVAMIAIVVGLVPALFVDLDLRFLLPLSAVLPLAAIGPAALLARWPRATPAALLAVPAWLLHPASPWRSTEVSTWMTPTDAAFEASIWIDLHERFPDARIFVSQPRRGGFFLVDRRGGSFLHPYDPPAAAPADAWLGWWSDVPAREEAVGETAAEAIPGAAGVAGLAERRVRYQRARFQGEAGTFYLLGPDGEG